jgi:hypothetical protein
VGGAAVGVDGAEPSSTGKKRLPQPSWDIFWEAAAYRGCCVAKVLQPLAPPLLVTGPPLVVDRTARNRYVNDHRDPCTSTVPLRLGAVARGGAAVPSFSIFGCIEFSNTYSGEKG